MQIRSARGRRKGKKFFFSVTQKKNLFPREKISFMYTKIFFFTVRIKEKHGYYSCCRFSCYQVIDFLLYILHEKLAINLQQSLFKKLIHTG